MIGIGCRRASQLQSQSRIEPLSGLNRLGLAVHLAICPNCRIYTQQLRWMDEALEKTFDETPIVLEDGARRRIASVLAHASGAKPAPSDSDS